jgi:hypothetical protein
VYAPYIYPIRDMGDVMKTHTAKRYIFKHYKFPISIFYGDPKESFQKAIKLLLKDIEENGLLSWDVEEITEEWGLSEDTIRLDHLDKEEFEV